MVIDGAVRDVGEIRKYGLPTWCRGATPKTGKCRIEAIEINGPVVLCGIQINPGDLIIADDSGICAIPPQHAEYVLKKCQQILLCCRPICCQIFAPLIVKYKAATGF